MVTISRKEFIRGYSKLYKKIIPNFGSLDQKVELLNVEDVGASYEPRIKARWKVWLDGTYKGIYHKTIILENEICVEQGWSN